MVSKAKTQYSCTECGGAAPKWSGQCPQCQQWNTMVETMVERAPGLRAKGLVATQPVQRLDQVAVETVSRLTTGSEEFDRVLGGGLVLAMRDGLWRFDPEIGRAHV